MVDPACDSIFKFLLQSFAREAVRSSLEISICYKCHITPGRYEGCDLTDLPPLWGYYPDTKAVLEVGESVIMYCKKPPTNPRLIECSSPDSISFAGLYIQFLLIWHKDGAI